MVVLVQQAQPVQLDHRGFKAILGHRVPREQMVRMVRMVRKEQRDQLDLPEHPERRGYKVLRALMVCLVWMDSRELLVALDRQEHQGHKELPG
jgi:hypothetical protein